MTRQKSFKRLVRTRMEKTGESYTAARSSLLAAEETKVADGPALTMADEAIRRRTGRGFTRRRGGRPDEDVLARARGDAEGGAGRLSAAVNEYERQLENLIAKGYPEAAGVKPAAFRRRLEPLREAADGLPVAEPDLERGRISFVIVAGRDLVGPEASIARVERRGKAAVTTMLDAGDLERFQPIERVPARNGSGYLIADVSTGRDTLNVTPDDALEAFEGEGRSPLTLDEGIALVTQFPEAVATNGGFSLPGSRRGDRRVTALWISEGAPKLGWCWAGNPHTWLGSASCARRVGA